MGYVEYDPFGVPLQGVGVLDSPYGYTGEYQEKALGLIYLRVRWYAPVIGRFLQIDPWAGDYERPQSLNRFIYVENNPTNFVDPLGLCTACRQGSVVTVGGTGGIGLAARAGPSLEAKILTRLPDGTRVVIAEDTPVPGSGLWWHSTYLSQFTGMFVINYGRVWLANQYLWDDTQPQLPANSDSSAGDWVLPLDAPITFWNGYGYYNWAVDASGTCNPCETYEQPELEYPGYACKLCFHKGWDMTSSTSTNVYAMGDGVLIAGGDATRLHISHTVNNVTIEVQYTHINAAQFTKHIGDTVKAGEVLGQYGTYGTNFAHLHLTVKVGGRVVNPRDYWPGTVPTSFTGSWGNPICVPPDCP